MQTFHIPGAPNYELNRSPAAIRVGQMAQASNLFMTHFEYRVPLDAPEWWLPEDRPDLGEIGEWNLGVLPEAKYQSFRNDLMIGSFHPGHRAKWTAHELCHALVGFAWRPDASAFFHACAARMAEILPVALFYFFDEIQLNRCPAHQHLGPLFGVYCADCELAAKTGPRPIHHSDQRWLDQGRAFVTRELEAVKRSIQLGRPIASPWGSLDLCSDGLAYASAQKGRLQSPEYATFVEQFFPEGTGCHPDLESLEARIIEVMDAILSEDDVKPWPVSHDQWKSRDIGWRLSEIAAQTDGDILQELRRIVSHLAEQGNHQAIEKSITDYTRLFEEYELPEPTDVFAVGYDLPLDHGRSFAQIKAGVQSVCPLAWEALDQPEQTLVAFQQQDLCRRDPLGKRFSTWLAQTHPGHAADLALFEAAAAHLSPIDAAARSLDGDDSDLQLNPEITLLQTTWAVLEDLDMIGIRIPGEEQHPPCLLIRRGPDNMPQIIHAEPHIADYLRNQNTDSLSQDDRQTLIQAHILTPKKFSLI